MPNGAPVDLRKYPDRVYPATLVAVKDGDTVDVLIDVGFGITAGSRRLAQRVRFAGVNAPELSTAPGQEARVFLAAMLDPGAELTLQVPWNYPRDGRGERWLGWLAAVPYPGTPPTPDQWLNARMLAAGHAVTEKPYPPTPGG